MKPFIKKIKIPIYKTELWFCITPNKFIAKKWFKSVGVNTIDWPENSDAHTWTKNGCFTLVWLPGLRGAKHISHLIHEVTHACWYILNDSGVKISEDNHEALTYLQSFVVKSLLTKK